MFINLKVDVGILVLQTLNDVVRVLHRDISPNNLLYVYDESLKAKCLLINFDYAVSVGRLQQASHGFRTVCFVLVSWFHVSSSCMFTCSQGAPPFMALEIMLQSGKDFSHELRHDLESLLYVIFWVCNHITAAGIERDLVDGNIPHIRGWCNNGVYSPRTWTPKAFPCCRCREDYFGRVYAILGGLQAIRKTSPSCILPCFSCASKQYYIWKDAGNFGRGFICGQGA